MSNNTKRQPEIDKENFVCPHCKVLAQQKWVGPSRLPNMLAYLTGTLFLDYRVRIDDYSQEVIQEFITKCNKPSEILRRLPKIFSDDFSFAECQSCSKATVWHQREMIYPRASSLPDPNEDMDDAIKQLYREARTIFQDSPRASAALLRLCVEKLCRQLGEEGDLNTCIKKLVKKGLAEQIQQALDYCRVIGNEALHPGRIDIEENVGHVSALFSLVNDIAQEMITKHREIREMKQKYSSLPEENRKQIAQRDGNEKECLGREK